MNIVRSAIAVSVLALLTPAAAHADSTTVNSAGYVRPDGGRGVVTLADAGAAAVVPGGDSPIVVSLGDSYISGEAGRWAGNVSSIFHASRTDALGAKAYADVNAKEAIAGCHRAQQAEVNFGPPGATSVNLACSGAITTSVLAKDWKPGIDFAAQKLANGATGYGQAQMLQNLAAANKGRIQMVMLSIGGNDFNFGPIVGACAQAYITGGVPCSKDPTVTGKVAEPNVSTQRAAIAAAIGRVLQAVGDNGGEKWTLLVQDYPSPVATSDTIRYGETVKRWADGGCPMYNKDLDWANAVALNTIDDTVKAAAQDARTAGSNARIEFLELRSALIGHRLCETNTHPLDQSAIVTDWKQKDAVDSSEWAQAIRALGQITNEAFIYPFKTQESLHPNYWAQLAYQNCLLQAYGDGTDIRGGSCVYDGPGLDQANRPRMKLLRAQQFEGTELGRIHAVRTHRSQHSVTISWQPPNKAEKPVHYAYELRVNKGHWSGWISLGTAQAVDVPTRRHSRYHVKIATEAGTDHGQPTVVHFAGR